MCALARVTPTSFVFMGGDACHHNGEFRPSPFRPLPDSISPHPFDSTSKNPCPGSLFEKILRDGDKTKAFYEMKKDEKGGSDLAVGKFMISLSDCGCGLYADILEMWKRRNGRLGRLWRLMRRRGFWLRWRMMVSLLLLLVLEGIFPDVPEMVLRVSNAESFEC